MRLQLLPTSLARVTSAPTRCHLDRGAWQCPAPFFDFAPTPTGRAAFNTVFKMAHLDEVILAHDQDMHNTMASSPRRSGNRRSQDPNKRARRARARVLHQSHVRSVRAKAVSRESALPEALEDPATWFPEQGMTQAQELEVDELDELDWDEPHPAAYWESVLAAMEGVDKTSDVGVQEEIKSMRHVINTCHRDAWCAGRPMRVVIHVLVSSCALPRSVAITSLATRHTYTVGSVRVLSFDAALEEVLHQLDAKDGRIVAVWATWPDDDRENEGYRWFAREFWTISSIDPHWQPVQDIEAKHRDRYDTPDALREIENVVLEYRNEMQRRVDEHGKRIKERHERIIAWVPRLVAKYLHRNGS